MIEMSHDSRAEASVVDEHAVDGPVSIVDTTELRWFSPGQVPPDIMSWFTHDETTGAVEQRCDTYQLTGWRYVGVKRRYRETLELKVRRSIGEALALATGLGGRLEAWRKWSPADTLLDGSGRYPWIDVHKLVIKRRFSLDGEELALPDTQREMTGAGCDVEVAAIGVGEDIGAWTFAFAAFGPSAGRHAAILTTWQALVADTRSPERLGALFGRSMSYPEWLALTRSEARLTPSS